MFNFDQIKISTWNNLGLQSKHLRLSAAACMRANQQTSANEISNGTTGVPMSLAKNCNGWKGPSASHSVSRDSFRLVEAQIVNFSEINSHGSMASGPIFAEDFTMEHSLPGLRLSPVEISSCY
jgi:hypothetical protein